jgi:hypothetical protein
MSQMNNTPYAIDNNVLVRWVNANDSDLDKLKLDYLLKTLTLSQRRLIIPAPVVAEFLVHAHDARHEFLNKLTHSKVASIASFDYRAALECSLLTASAIAMNDRLHGATPEPGLRQKIKVDEQIVAIARVQRCETILSADPDIPRIAGRFNIAALTIEQLPLPPEAAQLTLLTPTS